MAHPSPIYNATQIIIRDFDLDPEKAGLAHQAEEALQERLLFVLTHQIAYLIAHDIDRLKWILYRIDVSEAKLMAALADNHSGEAPRIIAQLIIDRQIQKAITRQQFSSGDAPEWKDC